MIYDHVSGSLSELDAAMVRAIPEGGNWRNLPPEIDSARIRQIRRSAARGEGSRSTYYGRLTWDRPCYTISTYFNRPGNGCFIHPSANRLITIREAARFQSFPDAYRFYGRGRSRYLQVGNAVPPLLGYYLGGVLTPGPLVDLFCGAGGMSLGLEWAGFRLLAGVDNDPTAIQTFQQNRAENDCALSGDLGDTSDYRTVIDEVRLRASRHGPIALLAGGPPCQGFSTAGYYRSDDSRNTLVHAFVKAVADLEPRQVLMENVASLTFRRHRPVLKALWRRLHGLGYRTSFIVAHAEGYGVPQLRRRLFLLGTRDSPPRWPSPVRTILRPMMRKLQPLSGDVALKQPVTVRESIDDLPVDPSDYPDEPLRYVNGPSSEFQAWARGDIDLGSLCSSPVPVDDSPLLGSTEVWS